MISTSYFTNSVSEESECSLTGSSSSRTLPRLKLRGQVEWGAQSSQGPTMGGSTFLMVTGL